MIYAYTKENKIFFQVVVNMLSFRQHSKRF